MKYLGLLFLFFIVSVALGQETDKKTLSPEEAIKNSFLLFEKKKFISLVTVTTNDRTNGTVKEIFRFVSPDSYHTEMFYNNKKEFETITIGKESYDFYQGIWEKSDQPEFGKLNNFVQQLIEDETLIKNAKILGSENVNGFETTIYQYEYDVDGAKGKIENQFGKKLPDYPDEITIKIWINKNGLPLKKESVRRVEGVNNKIETIVRVTNYEFDKKIEIKVPNI